MKHQLSLLATTLALLPGLACTSGTRWAKQPLTRSSNDTGVRLPSAAPVPPPAKPSPSVSRKKINAPDDTVGEKEFADVAGPRPKLKLKGERRKSLKEPVDGRLLGTFRNTYYDFPAEFNHSGAHVPLMNRSCKPIREVPRDFYNAVCVQGSGTLATGQTVSFARRDCACASVCPRTGQKICFDELSQKDFPWGRGALGTAITPLRTIAVDSDEIPLGTAVYIPEYDGLRRRPGGTPHDGCFIAQDRGMKVVGKHVDVFTGNPSITQHMNQELPSNQGVRVYVGTARCQNLED